MPKKKTAKRASKATHPRSSRIDDHSFMIIVGGGFVILMIIFLFLSNRNHLQQFANYQMKMSSHQMANEQTVSIKSFAFSPESITVKVGTTVTWMNNDTVDHNVVADNGTFDTGMLASGEKGSYTFTKAGTYTYKCGVHPSMMGTVVVEE